MDIWSDGQTDNVVSWWVQGTWEEVVQGPGGKESAYFPGLLRNGGLALKTQGTANRMYKYWQSQERDTLIKNNIKFALCIRKFWRDRVLSHIWLTASSYIALLPIPSEFPYTWGKFLFSFLSVYKNKKWLCGLKMSRTVCTLTWKHCLRLGLENLYRLWQLTRSDPYWARICSCLRSPGIDSKESIPPAFVPGGLVRQIGPPGWESIPGLKRFTNSGSGHFCLRAPALD